MNNNLNQELEFPTLPERLELLARTANISNDALMTVLCNLDNTDRELRCTLSEMGDMGTEYDHNLSNDLLELDDPENVYDNHLRYDRLVKTVQEAYDLLNGPSEIWYENEFEANDVVLTKDGHRATVILVPAKEGGHFSLLTASGQWVLETAKNMKRIGFNLFVEVSK